MDEIKLSDELLDASYKMLTFSMCETESEKEAFKATCEICKKYDLSFRKFMMATDELTRKFKELENNDVND